MRVLTDMGEQALSFFKTTTGSLDPLPASTPCPAALVEAFFSDRPVQGLRLPHPDLSPHFPLLLLIGRSPGSNLEILSSLQRRGVTLPDGLVCLAGTGEGFLGRHDRSWRCAPGNLHAVIHLKPCMEADRAGCAFSILAAVACADALGQRLPASARTRIKWINDVEVKGRKIAGVLTRQVYQDPRILEVSLGIGVNVLQDPGIPKNPFVPGSGCLADLFPDQAWSPGEVLVELLQKIRDWYGILQREGVGKLMEFYRGASSCQGREVRIYQDGPGFPHDSLVGRRLAARGRVEEIGDDLSLKIAGYPEPVSSGRLVFEEDCPPGSA